MVFILKHFPFFAPKLKFHESPVDFFGTVTKNQFTASAGLDKNAQIIPALFKMGFSFVEIGTVTPKPQKGNPKPRIFRLKKHKSLLNFMGFPNKGSVYILNQIKKAKLHDGQILGINIGRNKDGTDNDYPHLIKMFHKYCHYIVINISSPNTPNLRNTLSNTNQLKNLLSLVNNCIKTESITIPIFLKLTPDLPQFQMKEIYEISCQNGISGFVLTNTTSNKSSAPKKFQNLQMGGISGEILREKSLEVLKQFNEINTYQKFVFSCGGINSNTEAKQRLENGANAVQIYSSLIYGSFL